MKPFKVPQTAGNGQNIWGTLNGSKWVQIGPNGSKISKKDSLKKLGKKDSVKKTL